jgi:HEAT repeat protein
MMFVALAGAAVGANSVESLFFSRFGPHFLPYLYVVLGVVTFGAMMAMSALLGRPDPTRRLAAVVLGLAGALIVARGILFLDLRWFYPVLWVVMMIVWTTQVMACWAVAGAVHDTRQAKRLFPLYGSGLILGGVAGGLATGPLAAWLGAENLLFVWTGALAVSFGLMRSVAAPGQLVRRQRRRERRRGGLLRQMAEGLRRTRETPLLRWMSLSLILFALLYFTLALRFAETATARFPRTQDLAGFLGLFMGVSNGAALLVSLAVANRLFAQFGVPAMVLALAVIYLAGFTVLVVTSGFMALVAFRFVQMVWVNGVWATGWQALFNVVPSDSRARVRSFMDGGPLQAGIILSGLLLILAERVLGPRELHIAGVAAAILAVWAMWRARRAYSGALVEALRVGNPDVFRSEEEPFGGVQRDAQAQAAVMAGASDPDPSVRRVSVEILAGLDVPGAVDALERALADADPEVRAAALRGLAGARDPSVAPSVVPLLGDPEPPVRRGAVAALVAGSEAGEVEAALLPLLSDPDPEVRATAARALLRSSDGPARRTLLDMAGSPAADWRRLALVQLAESGQEPELVVAGLSDPDPSVRRAAASAVAGLRSDRSVDPLIESLGDPDPGVREAASEALAGLGPAVTARVVEALSRPDLEAGALAALGRLPATAPAVFRAYATEQATRASRYHELWRRLQPDGDERLALLAASVRDRALGHALTAVRAISSLGDQAAMELAVENLRSRDAQQRANALETLEAVGESELVRPLLPVWEGHGEPERDGRSVIVELLRDEDPWLRACAAFAAAATGDGRLAPTLEEMARSDLEPLVREAAAATMAEGEGDVETLSTLSTMERVLFLRKVRLFSDLPPPDLKQIAEIASEHVYPDGEVIAEQGEAGDEMHIVVSGEIRVMMARDRRPDEEVARRRPGDYVGEMAIISEEPRMASLVCSGEVRTLGIDRRRFERILRERPETSLAVMRVLCERLKESHAHEPIEARI